MSCCDNKFSAAAFKRRIRFENLSLTATDSGGQTESWATFGTYWASIEPKITPERFFAQRIEAITSHVIRMRYVAGLTTTMRILYKSRYFEVKSIVNVDEENAFLEILAMERPGT